MWLIFKNTQQQNHLLSLKNKLQFFMFIGPSVLWQSLVAPGTLLLHLGD